MLSMPVITTAVGKLRAYCRHSRGVTTLAFKMFPSPIGFIPKMPMCFFTKTGTTSLPKLRKCASITFSGICAVSKLKPCLSAISSKRKCTLGSLCPVKPIKRIFPAFFGFLHSFHRATFGEKPVGIFETDILVKHPQVDVIHFQTLQRFIELFQRRVLGAPVELGHHENFIPVTIFQGLAYAFLTYTLVVIP